MKMKIVRQLSLQLTVSLVFTFLVSTVLQAQNAWPDGDVYPYSGSGSGERFTAIYYDSLGNSNIGSVDFVISSIAPGTSGWSAGQCVVRYDVNTNSNLGITAGNLWLVPDAGGNWGSYAVPAGSSGALSNSQCTVRAYYTVVYNYPGESWVEISFSVVFSSNFQGPKQIYLGAEDASGNWSTNYAQQFGNFNVTQRDWHRFYPMARGQGRGQRAGNPWIDVVGQTSALHAQMTWNLPGGLVPGDDPVYSANRPNQYFPSVAAAWEPYYPSHQPEYYYNWWCQQDTGIFPQTTECPTIGGYTELITEVPAGSIFGVNPAGPITYLGLWAQGATGADYNPPNPPLPADPPNLPTVAVFYNTSVCDQLNTLTNLSMSAPGYSATVNATNAMLQNTGLVLPELFGIPANGPYVTLYGTRYMYNSTVIGPPTCGVVFDDASARDYAHIYAPAPPDGSSTIGTKQFSIGYIATSLFDDYADSSGHWIEAVNYYYSNPCPPNYPNDPNAPVYPKPVPPNSYMNEWDSTYGFYACVTQVEPYTMVDVTNEVEYNSLYDGYGGYTAPYTPNLTNGMVFWGTATPYGSDPYGNFVPSYLGQDYDWSGYTSIYSSPPPQQFSVNTCAFTDTAQTLPLNCY